MSTTASAPPSLLTVFRVREFRALWLAEVLSSIGDQFARVALAVAVFERTGDAALTGFAYALTFVPALFGGALLGGLGDRFSRRSVMIAADGVRAAVIAVAAVPGLPTWGLLVAVAAVALVNGPFKAAQQAMLPDVLTPALYVGGMTVRSVSTQTAQLLGFAVGGVVVTAYSPAIAFAVDAATFAVSGLLITLGVRARGAAGLGTTSLRSSLGAGGSFVWRDRRLRTLTALVWLAAFYVVPEALAAPYAAELGAGGLAVGAILAADPVGAIIGGIVWGQWVSPGARERSMAWCGVAAGAPLVLCVVTPPLAWSMLLFALSGAFATAYTVQAGATFVQAVPADRRARASGLLGSGLLAVQGVGALLAGVLADDLGPARTVAVAGAAGLLAAAVLAVRWRRLPPMTTQVGSPIDAGVTD